MTSPFLGHAGFGLRWGQVSMPKQNIGLTPISFVLNQGQTSILNWNIGLSPYITMKQTIRRQYMLFLLKRLDEAYYSFYNE